MVDETTNDDTKPLKLRSPIAATDISLNLASLLRDLSHNSASISDSSVTPIFELGLDLKNFETSNVFRHKTTVDEFPVIESEINKSLKNVKLISKLTNSRFSAGNIDVLNSVQMQGISAIKSLSDSRNGQIYFLIRSGSVPSMESGNGFANLLYTNDYWQQIQFSRSEL